MRLTAYFSAESTQVVEELNNILLEEKPYKLRMLSGKADLHD